jgi:uncharacterized protein involved in exopolysaccharide biosynthesis
MTETPSATSRPAWYTLTEYVVREARRNWLHLAGFALTGAIVAGGVAMLLPSFYRSAAAFQAETPISPPLSGSLGGIASQITGLQIGTTQTSPQLFGELLTTDAVLRRVARGAFPWRSGEATLPEVYGYAGEPEGWREYKTVRKLRKHMSVDVNIRTGVIRFSVEARTPRLAKALAETTLAALNEANIALRQARAAAEREFTSERAVYARNELAAAETALAQFYERNRVISNSPSLQMEEARLKRAVDMAQQVYVQLRLQAEQAAVQAVRNTPAISIVDPPLLPVKRSWPQRRSAVAIGFLIGLAVATLRLILRS